LQTLAEIGSVARIPEIVRRAKDKNDPCRLMGFGHRVYKSYDPRAPRYCAGAATRCSTPWGSATIRCSSWRWNWSVPVKERTAHPLLVG
jgi:hypothetical protein